MAQIISDLKNNFQRGSIHIQYIYINVGIFILVSLLGVFFLLFNRSASLLLNFVELPASFYRFLVQPWSIFTYMFMHSGLMHLLFNMLWLYWFGNLFLGFYSAKHFRGLYWLGGMLGGLFYMVAYNLFPYFSGSVNYSFLVGASASVLAIALATAYKEPDYPIRLLFIGTIRLKYLALFLVLTDVMMITGSNAGGHLAHLGGALTGLWFASSLRKGKDITHWLNRILDWVVGLFSGRPILKKRKPKMKVHYGGRTDEYEYNARKKAQSEKIDAILDKLRKSGYGSLTEEEKKCLFDASQR